MKSQLKSAVCLSLLVVWLVGCSVTTGHYLGAVADGDATTQIASVLETQQRWEEFFVTVDSRLTRQADSFQMTGWLSFSQHSRMVYVRVYDVELTLFLLDAENRVLAYRQATHLRGLSTEDRVAFAVTLPRVDEAVAYAFGYQITLIDDDGALSTNWYLPRTGR